MEYSEEEKKAIKEQKKCEYYNLVCEINPEFAKELSEMLGIDFKENMAIINTNILLSLIFKLQKEIEEKDKRIEELKEITEDYDSFPNDKEKTIVMASKSYFEDGTFVEKFIPKEAIIEKLNKLEKRIEEENNMLELNQICKEDYELRVKYLNYAINIYKELLRE